MFNKRIAGFALACALALTSVVPAFAQGTTTPTPPATVDLICMQKAVETHENASITASTTFSTNLKKLQETKRDALKAAWTLADQQKREEAVRTAMKNFMEGMKLENQAMKKAEKDSNKQFREDSKKCGFSKDVDRRDFRDEGEGNSDFGHKQGKGLKGRRG